MKLKDLFEISGNGLMYVLSATQTKEIFEIISLCLSILISLLIIISKIITWYNEAMKDGKITKDEVKQIPSLIKDEVNTIKNGANEIKKKGEDKDGTKNC